METFRVRHVSFPKSHPQLIEGGAERRVIKFDGFNGARSLDGGLVEGDICCLSRFLQLLLYVVRTLINGQKVGGSYIGLNPKASDGPPDLVRRLVLEERCSHKVRALVNNVDYWG